ncbi:hypothetical protein C0991_007714, partial [Blastosporella zonata]
MSFGPNFVPLVEPQESVAAHPAPRRSLPPSIASKPLGPLWERTDREQRQVTAGRISLRSGLSQFLSDRPSEAHIVEHPSSRIPRQVTLQVDSSYLATSVHAVPSFLLPPDHPPKVPNPKRKRPAKRPEPAVTTHPSDEVDSPGRPSSTSSRTTDSAGPVIHAPAPQRIHTLVHPAPIASAIPSRFLHSAPISDGVREGVDRGWSTAPSILGAGSSGHSTPYAPSPQPYPLREPHLPKRLKNRRTAPGRSSLAKPPPPAPRRTFLVPKQSRDDKTLTVKAANVLDEVKEHIEDVLSMPRPETFTESLNIVSESPPSSPVLEKCNNRVSSPISIPPPVDSPDSVLDDFVVESAAACALATRVPSSYGVDVTDRGRKLCDSFLNVFKDLPRYKTFLECRGERAKTLIDSMQYLLDNGVVGQQLRVIFIVALSRLCRKSELYPKRFTLHNVTRLKGTLAEGHFGEIEKGYIAGKTVCIKIPRFKMYDVQSFRRALSREIVPWAQICHENVLPFYGIFRLSDDCERLGIVSPFLENGNVVEFLRKNPNANRPSLVFGVAAGLAHLHDNGLVHGDIKGQNILVTDTLPPRTCIADFGFTTVTDNDLRSAVLSSNPTEGGTTQFEAPELFDPDITYRRTQASDVYAFSMASFE